MAERDIIGGIFTALGAGLAGAAGQEDQFLRLMEQMKQGRSEDQKKIDFGKIRLAALGYDVSGINSEEDLVAEQARIEQRGAQYDRKISQFNEMIEAQETTTAQWREQGTPVEPGQIAGFDEGMARLQNLRGDIERLKPPGADTSTYDYRISGLNRGYQEAKALSDARTAATYAANGDWGKVAESWVMAGPNTRTSTEMMRTPEVNAAFKAGAAAHQAIAGLREVDGKFVGPPAAVKLRLALSDSEGNVLPWAEVQGDQEMLTQLLQASAQPDFGANIEKADTAFTAQVEETETRDLAQGLGFTLPDAEEEYRRQDGSFDRVRFYRDMVDRSTQDLEGMDIRDLSTLATNMKGLATGQPGDPATAVINQKLQEVNRVLLERFEGDPDAVERVQEAEFEQTTGALLTFLDESAEGGEAMPAFTAVFPQAIQDYEQTGPAGPRFFQRAPRNAEERMEVIAELNAKVERGEGVSPREWDFLNRLASMRPQDREKFIMSGKPPEFDAGRNSQLFVQAVMPPQTRVDYGGLEAQMRTIARDLEAAGLPAAEEAALDAEYYAERKAGQQVGTRGLRTAGLALASYAESGDLEDIVTRIAGDFPAAAQQQLTGQTAAERTGLTNLEDELSQAEGTGPKALVLLRGVENGVYNAAGLQFGTAGERAVARAEAEAVFARLRETLQTYIDFQEENGLTDEEMAKRFGGKGSDWTKPLFEALGEASLGL